MEIRYTNKVKHHDINKNFKCLVIAFRGYDTNLMLHRTATGRIHRIDYMPRVEEMISIIKAYMAISDEFKDALKQLMQEALI